MHFIKFGLILIGALAETTVIKMPASTLAGRFAVSVVSAEKTTAYGVIFAAAPATNVCT